MHGLLSTAHDESGCSAKRNIFSWWDMLSGVPVRKELPSPHHIMCILWPAREKRAQ